MKRLLVFSALLLPSASASAQVPDFTRDIQPIFQQSCYPCHAAKAQMGGLRLDSRKIALDKVIDAGHSANSTLVKRITGAGDQPRMPLSGKPLTVEQIALIKRWIDAGASWPASASVDPPEASQALGIHSAATSRCAASGIEVAGQRYRSIRARASE